MSHLPPLLLAALPHDINPCAIEGLAPLSLWQKSPREAVAQALGRCLALDWEAYLDRYPDVRAAGVDPREHFLVHGLFEGRKLSAKIGGEAVPDAPLVSILIANYNNAFFLGKCLESVMEQTLRDIEIIVVDDCSSDDSLKLLPKRTAGCGL